MMVFLVQLKKMVNLKKRKFIFSFCIIIQNIQLGLLLGFFIDAFKVGS
uniref:Ycf20 n=1 Tax=Caulerpa lentillifera TaxID=148947 RepID=A0A345HGX0_9CHLO|nr:Ycf20 [Caulerpa lentillifera]AXG75860.1 Ycf20 [Caulerpa lentillifera]QKS32303.1 Ycf20 [Caulerpa lentillifera]